jgi:hypothetical protein
MRLHALLKSPVLLAGSLQQQPEASAALLPNGSSSQPPGKAEWVAALAAIDAECRAQLGTCALPEHDRSCRTASHRCCCHTRGMKRMRREAGCGATTLPSPLPSRRSWWQR